MNVPRVSVIVACYNSTRFLEQTIQSVLRQTIPDWELIAVDDASKDETLALLNRYAEQDERIIVLQHARNRGIGAARNTGLARARGEFVCFVDHDDLCEPTRFARQVAEFERGGPTTALVYSDYTEINSAGERIGYYRCAAPGATRAETQRRLFIRDFVPTQSAMARRACFEDVGVFDAALSGPDDHELWVRFAERYDFAYIAEPLSRVRKHEGNTSSKCEEMARQKQKAAELMLARHPQLRPLEAKRQSTILFKRGICRIMNGGDREAARRDLMAAVKLNARSRAAVFALVAAHMPFSARLLHFGRRVEIALRKVS